MAIDSNKDSWKIIKTASCETNYSAEMFNINFKLNSQNKIPFSYKNKICTLVIYYFLELLLFFNAL